MVKILAMGDGFPMIWRPSWISAYLRVFPHSKLRGLFFGDSIGLSETCGDEINSVAICGGYFLKSTRL